MGGLYENNYCDLHINDILIPIVHNAIATEDDGYPTVNALDIRPNHYRTLEESLNFGYRGLSLDICNCSPQGSNNVVEYQLCHGVCDVGSRDVIEVFTNIVKFLNANPTEIIVVIMQLEDGLFGELEPVDLNTLFNTYLAKVNGLQDLLYVHRNIFDEWPTLRTLIYELDKRLVIFHHDGPTCDDFFAAPNDGTSTTTTCPPGLNHYLYTYAIETDFDIKSIDEINTIESSCRITRGNPNGDSLGKTFFVVNGFLTPPTPDTTEQTLLNEKEFIWKRVNDCKAYVSDNDGGGDNGVNFYYVDFWSKGDVLNAVQTYNTNIAAAATPANT